MGRDKQAVLPTASKVSAAADALVPIVVVGAHLSGMPLNRELTDVQAELRGAVTTAPDYRLFVLPNTSPPKPGLLRAPGSGGEGIKGEVWLLDAADFGRFVARIPAPLGIGKVVEVGTGAGFEIDKVMRDVERAFEDAAGRIHAR
jgi:allophanate hydrolase